MHFIHRYEEVRNVRVLDERLELYSSAGGALRVDVMRQPLQPAIRSLASIPELLTLPGLLRRGCVHLLRVKRVTDSPPLRTQGALLGLLRLRDGRVEIALAVVPPTPATLLSPRHGKVRAK